MSLDPKATADAKAKDAQRKAVKPRLNPPFPWRIQSFDLTAFGLQKDPPAKPRPVGN